MRRPIEEILEEARSRIDRVTPVQAAEAASAGALIVDTRCAEDRERDGVVPGSVHIPRTVLEWRADPFSPHRDERLTEPEKPLVIMCAHGYSSSFAVESLQRMGAEDVSDMIGGFEAWAAAGLPVDKI